MYGLYTPRRLHQRVKNAQAVFSRRHEALRTCFIAPAHMGPPQAHPSNLRSNIVRLASTDFPLCLSNFVVNAWSKEEFAIFQMTDHDEHLVEIELFNARSMQRIRATLKRECYSFFVLFSRLSITDGRRILIIFPISIKFSIVNYVTRVKYAVNCRLRALASITERNFPFNKQSKDVRLRVVRKFSATLRDLGID